MIELRRLNGHPCVYCGRKMRLTMPGLEPTRDHVWPRSQGGRYIEWACWTCNNMKGDLSPEEWKAFMQANPEWWR